MVNYTPRLHSPYRRGTITTMSNTVELLTLRRPTKYNTRLTVPSTYVHAHNLRDGDRVLWIPQPDGVLLKFSPSLLAAPASVATSHGGEQ